MIKVLGGDFGEDFYLVERTKFDGGLVDVLVKTARFSRNKIACVEKIDDQNKRSILATVSGAGVGALLAGPIGMLVGAMIGISPTRTVVFLVTFRDNRRILCTGTGEEFTRYLSASMDAAKQHNSTKHDWSFIEEEPQDDAASLIFCCPYCRNQFSIAGEHVGAVVACPYCSQHLTLGQG